MRRHVFGGSAGLIRDGWSVMDGPTNWNPSARATRVACVHPFTVRFQGWMALFAKLVSQPNDGICAACLVYVLSISASFTGIVLPWAQISAKVRKYSVSSNEYHFSAGQALVVCRSTFIIQTSRNQWRIFQRPS